MSYPSTHHHHSLLNSIPQTHHHHHQLKVNLSATIKPEYDSDEDVILLSSVPKVPHTPENYDPECQCSTCRLVKRLLAKCTCEECKGQQTNQVNQGQVVLHSENLPIASQVSPTNGQPSSSSIQNNDASTSEHTNANNRDDDHSRSSTPDYLPRFFGDESGDSSSDESENDDSVDDGDDKELESESEEDNDNSDPDYAIRDSSLDDSEDDDVNCKKLDQENDSDCDDENIDDPEYVFARSSKYSKRSKSSSKHSKTSASEKRHKCPLCNKCFTEKHNLKRHYRVIHQQLKPYYCKWPKCEFVSGRLDSLIDHITVKHFNHRKNANKANLYVGKRKLAGNRAASVACNQVIGDESNGNEIDSDNNENDSVSDKSAVDSDSGQINLFNCPKCESNFDERGKLLRHYRFVHLQWKPFYCKWLKCDFEGNKHDRVVDHAYRKHLGMRSLKKARKYVGKREWPVSSQEDPVYESILSYASFNSNCPKCNRNFTHAGHFRRHLGSHKKGGFCCTWLLCGFFFSELKLAKKHVLGEHFKGKLVNSTQLNEHLIKVEPNLSKQLHSTAQSNDAFTSEHINGNDQNDDHSRSSTPDYLPRFFDDESGDSSSDDSEDDDDSVDGGDDEDYKELDQVNEIDDADDDSDSDYAFSEQSTSKLLKKSNKFTMHAETIHSKTTHKCQACNRCFSSTTNLNRHYRAIHQKLKPYYCKWLKCNYVAGRKEHLVNHNTVNHFNRRKNVNKANIYIGKRKLNTNDGKVCRQCKRIFFSQGQLRIHLGTHKNPGFRCQWPECGFFYSTLSEVKKHLCADHFHGKVEISNTQKINKYCVKVNHRTGETSKIKTKMRTELDSIYNSQTSTSCVFHPASTNPETLGDESSSTENESDDNEIEDKSDSDKSTERSSQVNSFDCPKCESTFTEKYKLLRHYRRLHLEWKPYYCKWPNCDFVAGIEDNVVQHAYHRHLNSDNRKKAKSYVAIRKMSCPPPKDAIYETILRETFNFECPKCGRNIKNAGLYRRHLGTHKKIGFRCTWPQCGYFYSELTFVKQHIQKEHFGGKPVNASAIHEHIVKVDPKTGRTSRIQCRSARVRTDDEEDSNDGDADEN